jgi:hypothetical protein
MDTFLTSSTPGRVHTSNHLPRRKHLAQSVWTDWRKVSTTTRPVLTEDLNFKLGLHVFESPMQVQFGSDVAAAQRFATRCSSMECLLSGNPELAAALTKGTEAAATNMQHAAAAGPVDSSSSGGCAGVAGGSSHLAQMMAAALQRYRVADVKVLDLAAAADERPKLWQQSQLEQSHAPTQQTAVATDEAGAVPRNELTAGENNTDLVISDSSILELSTAAIPLPYAYYRLVGEDGQQIERPDKHPFALSRVLYDARCAGLCHAVACCAARVCVSRGGGGGGRGASCGGGGGGSKVWINPKGSVRCKVGLASQT